MAKGATPKKKREDENRQNSQQREETRQRQTQREPDRSQANSRQTTRRDVAPTAIPVLEERTPRRSASGRNVAALFPEYEAPQTTNIPKVEPILTENRNQGFAPDIDSRVQRRNAQGIRLDAEDRIKASDASQYGSGRAERDDLTMPAGRSGDYQGEGGGHAFGKRELTDYEQYEYLKQNSEFENDIAKLAQINTGSVLGVSVNPDLYAKGVTGGKTLDEYYAYLEDKYNLSADRLDDLALTYKSQLNNEQSAKISQKAEEFSEEHPVLGSIASLPMTLANTVEGVNNVLVGGLTGDERRLSNMASGTKQGLREGAKENIDSNAGKVAYDLGMGLGDLGVGVATGQAPAILAGNTANEATLSAVDRGQDTRKAALYGAGSGVLDYITNTIGLDKARALGMDSIAQKGVRGLLKRAGIAAATEAGENLIQDLGQTFLDELINGKQSEIRTALTQRLQDGESVEDAYRETYLDWVKDRGMSLVTGALMGGAMFGGTAAINGLRGRADIPTIDPNNPPPPGGSGTAELPKVDPVELARQNEIDVNEKVDNVNRAVDEINNLTEQIPNNDNSTDDTRSIYRRNIVDIDSVIEAERPSVLQRIKDNAHRAYNDFINKKNNPDIYKEKIRLMKVPQSLAEKVRLASGGEKNIIGKDIALNLGKLKHEIENHSNHDIETSRDQIEYGDEIIDKIIDATLNPDIVENMSNTRKGYENGHFAIVKRDSGYIIIVEEIGSGKNTTIVPQEIIHVNTKKLDNIINSGRSIADLIYEGKVRKGDEEGNANDIKNRVTAAIGDDSETSPSSYTPETPPRSPLSDSKVNQIDDSVNPDDDGPDIPPSGGGGVPPTTPPNGGGNVPPANGGGSTPSDIGQRRTFTNTGVKSGVVDPYDLENNPVTQRDAQYEIHHNSEILDEAKTNIANNRDMYAEQYSSGTKPIDTDLDMDQSMILLHDDSLSSWTRDSILRNLAEHGTKAGQFIQAFAKWANTATGALAKATKVDVDTTKKWESRNKKGSEANGQLSRKLKEAIDTITDYSTRQPGDPAQLPIIRQQVQNTINAYKNTWIKDMNVVNNLMGDNPLDFSPEDIDYLSHMLDHGATINELKDALNTKVATGRFGISSDTQNRVNELFQDAKQYDENSQEFVEAQAEAYRLLAEEVAPKATALEKFDTWRYMAMLGNPKTMLRNFVGNKMFSAVTGMSNNLAAAMEKGVDWTYNKATGEHIQRTKTFLNPAADKSLINAAKADARVKEFRNIEGSKYEKMDQDSLKRNRSVWRSDLMQLAEKAIDAGISDTKAVINKYATSLAGYMKANGIDKGAFDATYRFDQLNRDSKIRLLSPAENAEMESLRNLSNRMEKARQYALKQAEYATFHEDNALAKFLTEQSNKARNSDNGIVRGLGYALEGTIPFKKTPANILVSGFEYSPFGAIKSIAETGKLIYENTGSRKGNLADEYTTRNKLTGREKNVQRTLAADVIDSWSKTLTGAGLTALGYYLFNKGILTSSEAGEKYQDQLEGKGNYAININGHTYTLDWAAPGVMPLLVGAEVSKVFKNNGQLDEAWYSNPDQWMQTINGLLDPMLETSMLSGLKDTLQNAANEVRYNEGNALGGILGSVVGNTLTGYATQAIPTLSGQIARTIDPVRRTTDTVNEGILGTIEKQGRKAANKIPFLSMLNTEYRDAYGRGQTNSPFDYSSESLGDIVMNVPRFMGNLAYQMISPGYYDKMEVTPGDVKGREIYNGLDENGKPIKDEKVFADWRSTKRINGVRLDPEQLQTFREEMGQANYGLRNALAENEWFNSLPATKQNEIFKSLNTIADKIGQYAVMPESVNVSGELETYLNAGGGEAGIKAVVDNLEYKGLVEDAGTTSNTKVGEAIQNALDSGDMERVNFITNTAQTLSGYGLKPAAQMAYIDRASELIPGLDADTYGDLFRMVDADGDGKVEQAEIIDALPKLGATNNDSAMTLYQAFYTSYADNSKVPEMQSDGTFKAVTRKDDVQAMSASEGQGFDSALNRRREETQNEITTLDPAYQPTGDPLAEITSSGVNIYAPESAWNKAHAVDSSMTPQQFTQTYSAIDADGNGHFKKNEFINWLNSMGYDEDEAKIYLDAFYPNNWNRPTYSNGAWRG